MLMIHNLVQLSNYHSNICNNDFTPAIVDPLIKHKDVIKRNVTGNRFIVLDKKAPASGAEAVCKTYGFQLPEVRNTQDTKLILSLMELEDIRFVKAGIVIKPEYGDAFFISDNKPINYSSML